MAPCKPRQRAIDAGLARSRSWSFQRDTLLSHGLLRCRHPRNFQRMTMKPRKIARVRWQPQPQATEDEQMEIRHGKMIAHDPFTIGHVTFDVSEILGELCRRRPLDGLL